VNKRAGSGPHDDDWVSEIALFSTAGDLVYDDDSGYSDVCRFDSHAELIVEIMRLRTYFAAFPKVIPGSAPFAVPVVPVPVGYNVPIPPSASLPDDVPVHQARDEKVDTPVHDMLADPKFDADPDNSPNNDDFDEDSVNDLANLTLDAGTF
jgi:hypothetical protein